MMWTTQPRSDLDGLSAIVAGTGPLVLLLHGVGLRAEAWAAQINTLSAADYRVIAPDMAGHGEDRRPAQNIPVDLAGFIAPLAPVLDQPYVVIGHSMGAMMAMGLAKMHPQNLRGVVALNAIFQRGSPAKNAVQERADKLDPNIAIDPNTTLSRWFKDEISDTRQACEEWLLACDPRAYKAAYEVFAHEDGPSEAHLAQLPCPAFFVTGQQEPNSTPDMSRSMAQFAPNGRANIIEGAAHMLPMTHPEAVNATLLPFLSECFS
jgi:pimeloyl-ACP methyl ester carboxylesterase